MSTDQTTDTTDDDSTATPITDGENYYAVSTDAGQPTTLSRSIAQGLRKRARTLAGVLPEPGETYVYDDISDGIGRDDWQWFCANGVLIDHGLAMAHDDYPGGRDDWGTIRVWETPAPVAAEVAAAAPDDSAHPCRADSHGGVRTIDPDAGVYTCTDDDCERTFGRDTAEAILGGGDS